MLNSLKNIFLPEQLNGRYILAKRILGIDIGATALRATQLLLQGTTSTVEKVIEQIIPEDVDVNQAIAHALSAIMVQADTPDRIVTALPSSVVIFKKIMVPFLDREKIEQVVNFEVAPLLPFPPEEAVIDFVITEQDFANNRSTLLVAAVQHHYIEQHLAAFALANLNPDIITIDFFALYNLYLQTAALTEISGGTVIIDVGARSTRMAYILNGALQTIRTLPQGFEQLLHQMGSNNMMREQLIESGIDTNNPVILQAFTQFSQSILFTLRSFSAQQSNDTLKKIFLLGDGVSIKGFAELLASITNIPTELMTAAHFAPLATATIQGNVSLTPEVLMSTAIAFPAQQKAAVNLRKGPFALSQEKVIRNQLLTTITIFILIISTLIVHTYRQTSYLAEEIALSEEEIIRDLKKYGAPTKPSLDATLKEAEEDMQQQKERWFSFDSQSRGSFLKYLLELTQRIDRVALGLATEKITIVEGVVADAITIKGTVKSYEALSALKKALAHTPTPFVHIGVPEEALTFTIELQAKKGGE